jgi:hypothetical protein
MRIQRIATLLVTGLVLMCVRAMAANSVSATDAHPDFVSPYQPYELKLQSFFPALNRLTGVLLHVRINGGRPLRLVLDSGAESIVIDARSAHSLGLSNGAEIDLVGLRTKSAKTGTVESVDIGPLSFRNCRIDLVDGEVVEGADGVIPLAMFSNFLVRLDLPERTLRLFPYPDKQCPAVSFHRAVAEGDLLLVRTLLNRKHDGYVVLDTGAFCSAISREVAGTLDGSHFLPDLPIAAGTGAATGRLVSAAVRFEIAGQELVPDRVVALDLLNLSRHYGVEVVGVLGFPALRPYVLTIDYRNRLVKIEPKLPAFPRQRHRSHPENSPASLALR